MATYHCPQCMKELKKGPYPAWVPLLIGPLFGQLLKPLVCDDHGSIPLETLKPEERQRAVTRKQIGIIGGALVNIILLALILMSWTMR